MGQNKLTYTLTMSADQCHAVNEAVEFLMRLKLNQYREIPSAVLDWGDGIGVDEFCKRRDEAETHLEAAFKALFPTWKDVKKDQEWHRLYDLYQVIRKAIHDAEHPGTTGVDSYEPMCTAGEKMAKCEWNVQAENPLTKVKISKPGFNTESRE